MKLGVLAHEPGVLPFLEALRRIEGLSIADVCADDTSVRDLLRNQGIPCSTPTEWQQKLQSADALLIAGISPHTLAAAGDFVSSRRPVLVVTDLAAGPQPLFQLMDIHHDRPQVLVPLFCSGVSPVLTQVVQGLWKRTQQPLRKVEFHRHLGNQLELTPALIDRWLFQDLEWITTTFGPQEQVTMRTSLDTGGRCIEAEVILTGPAQPEVRWTLLALAATPGWRLQLHAGDISTTADWEANAPLAVRLNGEEQNLPQGDPREEHAAQQLRAWLSKSSGTASDWNVLVQLGEICASARRSLAKRRTLDIQLEEGSELSQFKSQMTAIGCGALLWALFGSVSLLSVATVLDPRDREYKISKSAGFVLREADFQGPPDIQFSLQGNEHFQEIASRWSATSPVLIVESNDSVDSPESRQRHDLVQRELTSAGKRDPEKRITVRPLPGKWFERTVLLGWLIVLGPLAVVLAAQGFILAARGKDRESAVP